MTLPHHWPLGHTLPLWLTQAPGSLLQSAGWGEVGLAGRNVKARFVAAAIIHASVPQPTLLLSSLPSPIIWVRTNLQRLGFSSLAPKVSSVVIRPQILFP